MSVTFKNLKKDAVIFSELRKGLAWWEKFKADDSLYIEVRKDNNVNVYFEGGSIARIHYCSRHKKLQVFTHYKYLGLDRSDRTYVECSDIIGDKIASVLELVKKKYSQKHSVDGVVPKEKWSEKYIQGNIILNSRDVHLDSEFAYKEGDTDIRIDLVRVVDGAVTFVELKRLDDARMLKSTDESPEVVEQMIRCSEFIDKHKSDILNYYKMLYEIKSNIGLPVPASHPEYVNINPELLIFDRWEKSHPARDKHRSRMEEFLSREGIAYKIVGDWK